MYIIPSIFNDKSSSSDSQSKLSPRNVADNFRLAPERALRQQAGIIHESAGTTERVNTAVFVDHNQSYTTSTDSTMDPTRYTTADSNTTLAGFFERPVEIGNLEWTVGGNLDFLFRPWDLWKLNSRVANRLSNYRNFKGILHVKFLVNGNQFYWGKAFASYCPRNSNTGVLYEDNFLSIMPATQRPHIWIDPTTSQGGQLDLPFFTDGDCLDLTNANGKNDFFSMGQIWVKSLSALEHTQSLTNPVRIVIYAWATGVELSSPTQTNMDALTPQAGKMNEYAAKKDPDKEPSSLEKAVDKATGTVEKIGAFAMATKGVMDSMTAVGETIAALGAPLGFSRPRELATETPMKITQTGDLANTDCKDTVSTLAMTAKQEVTIDPRTAGLGATDEMAFSHLNAIHSYFAKTQWNTSDQTNQPLISIPVTPMIYNVDNRIIPPTNNAYCFTTTAFTAFPFQYWRGDMTFRFQLACSSYHKGRLLIVWDPVKPDAVPELNTVYSRIVDISEERDFSITVGWGCPDPALSVGSPIEESATTSTYTIRGLSGVNNLQHNGVLTVYVLNDLVTSGSNTNPAEILVHCYSNDLKVWNPESNRIKDITFDATQAQALSPLRMQAGLMSADVEEGKNATIQDASNEAAEDQVIDVGGIEKMDIMKVLAGEFVESFRCCLKRYCMARRLQYIQPSIDGLTFVTLQANASSYFPEPGPDDPMTIQRYVSKMYSGWRGSTRHRYIPKVEYYPTSSVYVSHNHVGRDDDSNWVPLTAIEAPLTDDIVYANGFAQDESWSGMQPTTQTQANVNCLEQPFYANGRFAYIRDDNPTSRAFGHRFSKFISNVSSNVTRGFVVVDHYVSIGEDYNLFFFLGAMPFYNKA